MASQAIRIDRFDVRVRLVAFVAVHPRHRDPVREPSGRPVPMARKAARAVRNELPGLFRGERMAGHAGNILHSHAVDLPVLVTAKAGVPVRTEIMHRPDMALHALHLFGEHVARVARLLVDR